MKLWNSPRDPWTTMWVVGGWILIGNHQSDFDKGVFLVLRSFLATREWQPWHLALVAFQVEWW